MHDNLTQQEKTYNPLPKGSTETVFCVLFYLLPQLMILPGPDVLCTHTACQDYITTMNG